jgi:hypothetical protein
VTHSPLLGSTPTRPLRQVIGFTDHQVAEIRGSGRSKATPLPWNTKTAGFQRPFLLWNDRIFRLECRILNFCCIANA